MKSVTAGESPSRPPNRNGVSYFLRRYSPCYLSCKSLRPLPNTTGNSSMKASAAIQEMARQVRSCTLQILEAAEPKWLMTAAPGMSNHILWHGGHALWVLDELCVQLLTGVSELPTNWGGTFGMDCRPPQQTAHWPSRDELAGLLRRQLQRVLELLDSATDEQLEAPADPARGPATVCDHIIHGIHDEAKHSGEMYLLLKMCRSKPSVS